MSRRLLTLLAVALVAVVPACSKPKVSGEGLLDPNGRVLLTRDGRPATVSRSRALVSGDVVEVSDGAAKVTLPGGDTLELRPRSVLALNRGPDLRSGNVLVTASGPPRTLRATGNQVEIQGTTRVDVLLALRVAAYGGQAVIRTGGETVKVPALREASVPVVGVVNRRPLAIDRNDPWDQRLLGDAAAKEADLESRARGFTGQVSATNATSVEYYRNLLPGLAAEQAFQKAEVEGLGRPAVGAAAAADRFRAGDVLLGAAVALQGQRGTFADRLAGATAFRGEGASWSLVALDQQVPSIDGLLRLVDGVVNVAPLELAAPAPAASAVAPEPPPARPAPTVPRATAPRTPPTTRARPAPTTTTTPPAQPQQATPPPPQQPSILSPLDPLLEPVVDPVVDLLNDLLGN